MGLRRPLGYLAKLDDGLGVAAANPMDAHRPLVVQLSDVTFSLRKKGDIFIALQHRRLAHS